MRLGCLPYLNVKPLIYPFEHGNLPEGWELVYEPPSTLAKLLENRSISAAPVSSFACLANPELYIAPDICISSHGAVESVLMVSRVEPEKVKSVAADSSSLSGRALLRIILSENYGIEPEFDTKEPHIRSMLMENDAALIIGNPAMQCDTTGLHVVDLGADWLKLTGLPAVFAVWAGKKDSLTSNLIEKLSKAKNQGLNHIKDIANEESPIIGLSTEVCENYLANIIKYDLGPRELESLRTFAKKAYEHHLIDFMPEIRLVETVS